MLRAHGNTHRMSHCGHYLRLKTLPSSFVRDESLRIWRTYFSLYTLRSPFKLFRQWRNHNKYTISIKNYSVKTTLLNWTGEIRVYSIPGILIPDTGLEVYLDWQPNIIIFQVFHHAHQNQSGRPVSTPYLPPLPARPDNTQKVVPSIGSPVSRRIHSDSPSPLVPCHTRVAAECLLLGQMTPDRLSAGRSLRATVTPGTSFQKLMLLHFKKLLVSGGLTEWYRVKTQNYRVKSRSYHRSLGRTSLSSPRGRRELLPI